MNCFRYSAGESRFFFRNILEKLEKWVYPSSAAIRLTGSAVSRSIFLARSILTAVT